MKVSARVLLAVLAMSAYSLAHAAAVIFEGSGASAAGIQAAVDMFRTALGPLNPNVVGSFATGRREINWDGVPDALSAPNLLPANFFNVNSPRGVIFNTPGTGFEVSANAASGTPVEFGNINAAYPALFQSFTAQRLFTALGSNIVDVSFLVPGTAAPAFSNAFGAVFTDVDLANSTSLQFFNLANQSLGTFFVPVGTVANGSLSFLGVQFNAGETIGRVRITSGNTALGPNETGGIDLVVMDDFIYAEPRAAGVPAAQLTGAASRKVHGVAGTFDLPLSAVATNPSTEPRTGPTQTIVMTFDKPIASANNPTVTEGTAAFSTMSISGNDVILNFTGVTDIQYLTITLGSVASTDGGSGGSGSVRLGFLQGDVNQSRVVTLTDLGLINQQLAQQVTQLNFLRDVNSSGTLTLTDKAIGNAALTHSLPPP